MHAPQDPLAVCLVIPCYNEAARLDVAAFTGALAQYPWLSLLFVNDGSTDHTPVLLESLQRCAPDRVHLRDRARNGGKGEAVRTGLEHALTLAPVCGFWDADLSAPLDEVDGLRAVLVQRPEVDWVWGIRLRSLGRRIERRPLRHYLGRLFATVSSMVLGVQAYDTQCGAKLFRVSPLLTQVLRDPFVSRWIFDVELLLRGTRSAARGRARTAMVFEQPLMVWVHRGGSTVRASDFARACIDLGRLWLAQRGQSRDPQHA